MKKMGYEAIENRAHPFSYKFNGESVLDIGGGPCSVLLKCSGYKSATVIDPCAYPNWVHARYKELGIEYIVQKGEEIDISKKYDVCLIYNVLQHTEDPHKIIENALKVCKELRIFEWVNIPISLGHIHVFTENMLNGWLWGKGKVEHLNGEAGCIGDSYYGIFKGAYFGT